MLIKELHTYSKKHVERSDHHSFLSAAQRVQETLQQFREQLTLRKLDQLEDQVTKFFKLLLHKTSLVERVVIEQNTFGLSLYDQQGEPVSKYRLSAGEKQLLAIAFLWGLANVSGRQLPIAIDTPLVRLDSSHRQNLLEQCFPQASHQVILLSTDTEIGQAEAQQLREQDAILLWRHCVNAQKYLLTYALTYDQDQQATTVRSVYFW
jgi:DNA sulfur modification protein DndD